jgi:UDP-GlcNAc:undecaprenyl-phosphate/decaprenyl-phosphate GlcNAc-1-phosphate transferase
MNGVADFYQPFVFGNILIGMVLALVIGGGAIWLAKRIGLLDMPGTLPHKQHRNPVPLAGGLALIGALGIGALLNPGIYQEMWQVIVPALVVLGFGLWDDFKRLPAWVKLIGQMLAGILLIALGTYVQVLQPGFLGLTNPLVTWLNWFITLFWIIGITNAFNLIDSMDGLVIGTSGVALAFLILVTLGSVQVPLLRLLTLLLGICFGLYFYNHTPARLFLGDSGAQTIGFLLAAIGIQFTPGIHPLGSSWFIPILILGVPIFDTTLVTISRLRRRTPFYSAGLDHTYHRLVDMGLDPSRAVLIMHFATVVLGCIAFIALQLPPLYASLTFGLVCFAGLVLIFWMDHKK